MNHVSRIGRSLARPTRRVGVPLARHAVVLGKSTMP